MNLLKSLFNRYNFWYKWLTSWRWQGWWVWEMWLDSRRTKVSPRLASNFGQPEATCNGGQLSTVLICWSALSNNERPYWGKQRAVVFAVSAKEFGIFWGHVTLKPIGIQCSSFRMMCIHTSGTFCQICSPRHLMVLLSRGRFSHILQPSTIGGTRLIYHNKMGKFYL